MKYSQSGIHLTEQFEGCRLTAYADQGGVLTIGYGHTGAILRGQTCTQEQAEEWLHQDIVFAETEVNRLVKVPLTQPEFDALVDFTFNCGVGNFLHSTLLTLLNKGDYANAALEFEKWDKCAGQVVAGLLRRRLAEAAEFKTTAQGA